METVVLKLGGSLLDWPEWPIRFSRLLRNLEARQPLIVVGGGEAADIVRRWDRLHGLGDETAHRLAMRAMSFNAHLVCALLPDCRLTRLRADVQRIWKRGRIAVLDAAAFVDRAEADGAATLPRRWSLTSDSIAAWVAHHWPAEALVLLKSSPLPLPISLEDAAATGLVDEDFPAMAAALPRLGWCHLRADDESPRIVWWKDDPAARLGDNRTRLDDACTESPS